MGEEVRISRERLLARVAPFDSGEFEELYRRHAGEEMRAFDLEIPDLYVHTRAYDLSRAYIDTTASTLDSPNDRFDLSGLAARTNRLAIVGSGRSGSTAVLRHLFLNAISRGFTGPLVGWNGDIPIFLQLRYSETESFLPDHFLERVAGDILSEMPQGWVQHNLRRGKVLLLINGFAELSSERRKVIIRRLRQLTTGFPDTRFIIESSIATPELPALQQLGFKIIKLNNLESAEVTTLVARWHDAVAYGIPDSEAKARVF